MRLRARALIGLCTVLLGSAAAVHAAADPFVGTWVLDRQKSYYGSDNLPEQMVIVMTAAAEGVHYHSESKYANGTTSVSDYTAAYDGHLSIVTGSAGIAAPVSVKRIDDDTVEVSYVRGLRVVATSRRVASEDGLVMTVTTVSRGKDGNSCTNVAVFERARQ